jgi:hypothetical protein
MGYTERCIYGLMQIKLYYGSIWLKIGIAREMLEKVSLTKFQQNM